jgi:hypothetical protein
VRKETNGLLYGMRTLSGMEFGEEMVIYRRCKTQIIDAGTPTYTPTINFMAL